MALSDGDAAVLDDIFSYQIYNKLKDHFSGASAISAPQQGMIQHLTGDDRISIYDGALWRIILTGLFVTETKTDNYTVTTSDFGKLLVMNSASDKTFTLPSVTSSHVGAILTFAKIAAGKVTIDAADSDVIADSAAGGTIDNSQSTETYATLVIQLVSETKWSVVGGHGTWSTT